MQIVPLSLAVVLSLGLSLGARAADAAVLCSSKKGAVFVRDACKRKEKVVDPVALGLRGPSGEQGPAGPAAWERTCPPDSVAVGTGCIDTYEASVWRVPGPTGSNAGLVDKIEQGTATAADLTAGGATQLGTASDDYTPCEDSGQNCTSDIYAVSLAGVTPSRYITWFQAQAACTNARKRLPSNAEWQAAVIGTPDPGPDDNTTDCNTGASGVPGDDPTLTGSRSNCKSAAGAFDMVGNAIEWVADWVPRSNSCGTWTGAVSPGDLQCLDGATTGGEPAALARGGGYGSGGFAGPLWITAGSGQSATTDAGGFRCTR